MISPPPSLKSLGNCSRITPMTRSISLVMLFLASRPKNLKSYQLLFLSNSPLPRSSIHYSIISCILQGSLKNPYSCFRNRNYQGKWNSCWLRATSIHRTMRTALKFWVVWCGNLNFHSNRRRPIWLIFWQQVHPQKRHQM